MIASAAQAVLLADSSKYGKAAFVRFAGWREIDAAIVDDRLADETRQWLQAGGRNVVEVPM